MADNRVAVFWPGDYRARPNTLAEPLIRERTDQLVRALRRLGKAPYVLEGFLTRPHEAIRRLGPVSDPAVGVFGHWVYGPHTCDGVVNKDAPLLLASNFDGGFPGLVGLLNTAACLELLGRKSSRIWSEAEDWSRDDPFMVRLAEWCVTGAITYGEGELRYDADVSVEARARAQFVASEITPVVAAPRRASPTAADPTPACAKAP